MGLQSYADQSLEEKAHDNRVAYLTHAFRKLALPDRPFVFELEHALSCLLSAKKTVFQLSNRQCEDLLDAVLNAHAAALGVTLRVDRSLLDAGMEAAARLTVWWGQEPVGRARPGSHALADTYDTIRALRYSLLAELALEYITDRRAARRSATVIRLDDVKAERGLRP